ncbi:hypothetical protein SLEP1_g53816 [Rubroshorea leprosula]|uniref:Uncharacterized protein n=1 Tax=Rubroshorea leprosula TaxID=152421 RepID=A0AAV5MAE9_9ROSI|nr:hypothetical protein SLEP1_g53816 [Rubroshorea leprosula]
MTKITHINPYGSAASARSLYASSFRRGRLCASAQLANQAELALPDHPITCACSAGGQQATTLVSRRPGRPCMRSTMNTKHHSTSSVSNTASARLSTEYGSSQGLQQCWTAKLPKQRGRRKAKESGEMVERVDVIVRVGRVLSPNPAQPE